MHKAREHPRFRFRKVGEIEYDKPNRPAAKQRVGSSRGIGTVVHADAHQTLQLGPRTREIRGKWE
jgi:hypothetical protein